jgi:hypothetical protein
MKNQIINIDQFSLLNLSKQAITEQAQLIVDAVKEGHIDPLKAMAYTHKLLTMCKEIDANIRPLAQEALNGSKVSSFECSFSETKTASKFDYAGTGDIEYDRLLEAAEKANKALKEREGFLKSIKSPIEMVDTLTGETYTINPPVNTYSLSLKIEF